MAGFLNNLLSGVKLPEATFEVKLEKASINRLAVTVVASAIIIMAVAFIFKKLSRPKQ